MVELDVQKELGRIYQEEKRLQMRCNVTPRTLLGVSHFVMQTALSILSRSNMSYEMAIAWIMDPNRRG